eukprot:s1918_g11.t1
MRFLLCDLFKRYVDLSMPCLKGAGELEVAPLCPYRLFLPCVRHRDRRPRSKGRENTTSCIAQLGRIWASWKGGSPTKHFGPVGAAFDLLPSWRCEAQLQLAAVTTDKGMRGAAEVRLIWHIFSKTKVAIRSWGKYVPWPVVQNLLVAGEEVRPKIEEREVTLFFSDMASFTSIVEKLEPEQTLLLLSRYFNDMSDVIDKFGGIVIEFIGDAIYAVFGAPVRNREHAEAGVNAMLKMLKTVQRINQWAKHRLLPEVSIRCGVHSGPVQVGNMGFHSRLKYGVMGSGAEIPSKLEDP